MTRTSSAAALADVDQPDVDVIEQILGGQTSLFELLMRRHNERVYRADRSIVRDEQEAEDVMQQTYVNAFTHLRQFNGAARFSTWPTRIAINEALARVRRRGRYEAYDDELSNVEPFMSHSPTENPERQAFTHELAEVAECLAVSEDVVKTRLSRGRAALRRLLMERTGATAPDAFRFYRPRCDRVVARVLARITARCSSSCSI